VELLPELQGVLPAQQGDVDLIVRAVDEPVNRRVGGLGKRIDLHLALGVEAGIHVAAGRQRSGRNQDEVRL
jgi:hypothetical protein